jgi:hypothetical protein
MRRIGILLNSSAHDPQYQACVGPFLQALTFSGSTSGHNVSIEIRWARATPCRGPWGTTATKAAGRALDCESSAASGAEECSPSI